MIDNSVADIFGMVPSVPSFQLFQHVRSHYISDELEILNDQGIVIGVFYMPDLKPHSHQPEWWYLILWTSMPSSPHMGAQSIDQSRETDLRAI